MREHTLIQTITTLGDSALEPRPTGQGNHRTYIDSLGRNDYQIMCSCGWVNYCKLTRQDTERTAREHRSNA